MQNAPEREIDLMRLLAALWRRVWVIVGCAVVTALAALLITRYFMTPMYQASVSIYVDNFSATELNENYITASSLTTAQKLVKTYVTIIESDNVLNKVVEKGDFRLTAKEIRNMMSANQVNETEVFRIIISNADPLLAAKVANTIADVAPEEISHFLSGSSTKVIDYATVPTAPYTPNYQRNVALGGLIGAVIAAGIICLMTIMDARVKNEEELERLYEHPVLGSIPAFDAAPRGGKYGSGRYGYGYGEEKKEGRA